MPSSTVHYRNWNPPLLGNLPEDFLRILPQQTAPAGTQVSLATPSSLLCRVAWAPSQSSASLSLQHQHPGYQVCINPKVWERVLFKRLKWARCERALSKALIFFPALSQ